MNRDVRRSLLSWSNELGEDEQSRTDSKDAAEELDRLALQIKSLPPALPPQDLVQRALRLERSNRFSPPSLTPQLIGGSLAAAALVLALFFVSPGTELPVERPSNGVSIVSAASLAKRAESIQSGLQTYRKSISPQPRQRRAAAKSSWRSREKALRLRIQTLRSKLLSPDKKGEIHDEAKRSIYQSSHIVA